MEFASKAFEKALDLVVEVVVRQIGYIVCYKRNVKELNDCVEDLGHERDRVRRDVEYGENNGQNIEAKVTRWLTNVDEEIAKNETFQKDKKHANTGCSRGLLPFLWFRHRLGRKAKKMTMEVKTLLDGSKFERVAYQPEPMCMDAALSNVGYEKFESRDKIVGKIKAAVEDSSVRRIGIYGPGGVGKTTMVKEVAKIVKEDKLFNVVVMVNIGRIPNSTKIQGEIADMLGLRLDEESEIGRADRLRNRLKKVEGNILIILDDLWEELDLNKLGIPYDGDDYSQMIIKDAPNSNYGMTKKEKSSSNYEQCKILITSRSKEILSAQMDVKAESIFSVGLLEEMEAKTLYMKVAQVPEKNSEFENLAVDIVKKCAGLPMAIIAVGKALKNRSYFEQKEALEQLNKQGFTGIGVQKSMDFSIKLSYDHLESEELKLTFLLCARMGPRSLVMDLIKYCIGLGKLEGVDTIREARNRINRLIQKLKDSGLLLDNDSNDYFSMHDAVRDAALSIASNEKIVFILRNGELNEWPNKDELERCTVISLHNSNVIDELPEGLNCPQLEVFHIDSDDTSISIPDNFFEGMRKLRVLIMNGIHLPHLPSSIKCLKNLRMLSLEGCVLGDNLCFIDELKNLRILSLAGSEFVALPTQLGQLHKLRLLDISNCSKLKVIPSNVISNLTSLEELYMRNSLIQWEIEGETNQSQIVVLDELRHLCQLKTLDISILNAGVLPENLFFDKLDNYKIMIGDFRMLSMGDFRMPEKYETSRALALKLKEGIYIHSQKGIKMLFRRVEKLLLGALKGVHNAFYELNLEGFPCLKHLSIVNNLDIQYVISSVEFLYAQNVFPVLESLCLYKLEKLRILCDSQLTDDSFRNLKAIKVQMCSQLKNLFFFHMVRLLTKLEAIEVSECDSLEEIVVGEIQRNSDINVEDQKIEFPQLRFLTLQYLPTFTGFYTNGEILFVSQSIERPTPNNEIMEIEDEHDIGPPSLSLFTKQVIIPNIESLELCSINIHMIWNYQPSSSFCFQNLSKLNVNNCKRLEYLFSLSIAKNLANLKALAVSECEMMKGIFHPEEIAMDYTEIVIFPKLEIIQLTRMETLGTIWHSQVSLGSFNKLDSLIIKECEKLERIFPHHMIRRFQNLVNLEVVDCKSVEEIFDLKDTQTNADENETKLQHIVINSLPNLKHVWNNDPEGILNFKTLQTIEVNNCPNLKYLLPASVAKGLQNLQIVGIFYCDGMEGIVAGEEGSETESITFVFPQLISLYLVRLPKLRSFYPGTHTLEWKALKNVGVTDCEKVETFTTDTIQFEQVFNNLEHMAISLKEAKWLRHCIRSYRMYNLKSLVLGSLNSIDILYWFLHRMPNLKLVRLLECQFEELLPSESLIAQEKIGTVVQFKVLQLLYLPNLQNIGLERDLVLQRVLERLVVKICPQLIKLAPSSVSFSHLTYLEVKECNKLRNLMASSTAKSLVQLTTMKVINCEVMEEIVVNEGNGEEREVVVIFGKLITLELVALRNLSSFCSSKNYAFNFPSLETLLVTECAKMKIFTEGAASAPKLQKINITEGEEEGIWCWKADLNATMGKASASMVRLFARDVKYLDLSVHHELEEIWQGVVPVPDRCFSNLKCLVMEGCEFSSCAVPCHLFPFLSKLEELKVSNCDLVKVIFDVKDVRSLSRLSFPLKKLTLEELPNLEHVWSKDPHEIADFHSMREMKVAGCKCLKSLFPESVAKDLVKLEILFVENCEGLVEIIALDEAIGPKGIASKFVFPCLMELRLQYLPELNYFYFGAHKLECPGLKRLEICHCDELKIFTSESQSYGEVHPEHQVGIPSAPQAIFSVEKVIPNIRRLSLNREDTMTLWHGDLPENLLHELNFLWLMCFHDVDDTDIPPHGFLHKVPNIEMLGVFCSGFKQIFPSQTLEAECITILARLKELCLSTLPRLEFIGLGHYWVHLLKTLETLTIDRCPRLTKLVQSTVFFSSLKELMISKCHGLEYLFTSSVKSLVRLEQMSVEDCKTIKEIVAKEGDESAQDEIIFGQLKKLSLKLLPSLASFYNGKSTLKFSSLHTATIEGCPRMEIFSHGIVHAPMIKDIRVSFRTYPCPKDALNPTMEELFREKVCFQYSEHLELSEYPDLEQAWLGKSPIRFRNLKSLEMENLKFLSKAIPSHLLPYLTTLEELQVRSCTSMEAIFDISDTKTAFRLKKLILDRLPKVKHVWNENLQGTQSFQYLQQVHVTNCEGLKFIFPASVVKTLSKLKKLTIETCKALVEIVGKEEGTATEGETPNFVFPCLSSVTLSLMPELKRSYNGKHNLQCPVLKDLRVYDCAKLEIFTSESQSYHQAHGPEDLAGISIESQPLFQVEKVIPKLEELSLNEKETMMLWHGNFAANLLNGVKCLQLYCFHDVKEGNTLPYGFLQKAPNVETLALACCDFEEIFPFQGVDDEVMIILAQLRGLRLENLCKLNSIGLEHSWLKTLQVKILEARRCPCLTKLVESPVSFSTLRELLLYQCDGLVYLFTPSTAKSLLQLRRISVQECESIKEIMGKEGDESAQDEIIFEHLIDLSLNSLPSLSSFYTGDSVLKFSILKKVIIAQCPNMKIFSHGLIIVPALSWIQVSLEEDDILWEGDLNATVAKMFNEKAEQDFSDVIKEGVMAKTIDEEDS